MIKQEIIPLNLTVEDFIFKLTEKTTLKREDVIHWLLNIYYLQQGAFELFDLKLLYLYPHTLSTVSFK